MTSDVVEAVNRTALPERTELTVTVARQWDDRCGDGGKES